MENLERFDFDDKSGLFKDDSFDENVSKFVKKHQDFVFTLQSAFYMYGMSDVIPDMNYIASDRNGSKYHGNIKQIFMDNNILLIGVKTILYCGVKVPIYNKERLLIELIRYRNKLPFSLYKEIIYYYRDNISEIDFDLINGYLSHFPKKNIIKRVLKYEVF